MVQPDIRTPAGFAPQVALAFGALGAAATPVDPVHPLPVTIAAAAAAAGPPLAGSTAQNAVAGPFVPELGRPIHLSLSGTWSGSVQLLRSVDGGTTRLPLTVGGGEWARFTGPANEPVWTESEAGASFWLAMTIASGTLDYRVSQ